MWTYLTNSTKSNTIQRMDPFPLEIIPDEKNLNDIIKGYVELVHDGFFTSFDTYYDTLFISNYSQNQNPLKQEKKFQVSLL